MNTTILTIPAISCSGCANTIEKALSVLELKNILIDEKSKQLSFDCESQEQLELVKARLEIIGYSAN